ncbi:MAG: hypothetical protein WB779_04065 [Ignavibacteriaceae bacterium]
MLLNNILSVKGTRHLPLLVSVGLLVLAFFLSSCSANLPVLNESQLEGENLQSTKYSIIFIIHGDGDYLYHDNSGNELDADNETLAGAIIIAQQNPNAEVFIFHQKPRRHFLFFFPLRDGEFYYYRNGQLIANESYWRDQEKSDLEPEAELYNRFSVNNKYKMVKMFLYFGHEIPEFGGAGYDESYPERAFTVDDLADGMKKFLPDSSKFDLTILSTCFNGTPYTINTLGSLSRTIIASPDNLHLSYFDLHPLERLDINLKNGDVPLFAKKFAQQSFDRLTKNVQTAVSVVVYDVPRTQKYLNSVNKFYEHTLTGLKRDKQASLMTIEHCDCSEILEYVLPDMSEGVDVFFRSARFGKLKNRQSHSGWECWKYEVQEMQSQRMR